MEHKTAINILIELLNKKEFSEDEKEAINTAIGVLAWTKLAKSRIDNLKNKSAR